MEKIYISSLDIENVRHLQNITIPLSNEDMKHLIFTGKNGSGKTSVLEAMSYYLHMVATSDRFQEITKILEVHERALNELRSRGEKSAKTIDVEKQIDHYKTVIDNMKSGVNIQCH